MNGNAQVIWSPQPGPQVALLQCPVQEIFYGGARGGGKTEGSIGCFLQHADRYQQHANGIFFRRTAKQLEEVIARTRAIFPLLGAKFREQKSEWVFPSGARLKFRYLERDSDAEEYQGHSYSWIGIEEATNFPSPDPIDKIRATLRSAAGVPVQMVLTGNPGGPGHHWVKARYIDPAPKGYKVIRETFVNPFTGVEVALERVFIPSKVSDNAMLMQNDPTYVARLQQQGSAQLVRAWLNGDWDIVIGAFFDCWDANKHILGADWLERIPQDALRFKSFDWGSARPFSVGWYAVSDGSWGLPSKALVKFQEWYGASGPNKGLKLDAEVVAAGIREREKDFRCKYGVADPAIFIRDGGPSIAERMLIKRVAFKKGDNRRIVGWDMMRAYLVGEEGIPMLYFVETCADSIRTIPLLQHDDTRPEDVDTDGEDHAGDETRYACTSRPWVPRKAEVPKSIMPKLPNQMTINDLLAQRKAARGQAEAMRV